MTNTDGQFERAAHAYQSGRLDEALTILADALDRSPDDGRMWELCGLIHRDQQETELSVDALERASLLVPLKPLAGICLAEGYAKLEKTELARDLFVQQLELPRIEVESILHIAVGLDECGFPGLAMKACRQAQRMDPNHAQTYYDTGFYAARCGYPINVVASLARRAIALDPEQIQFRIGLASLLYQHEHYDAALDVVGEIRAEQIAEIDCRCCLERIGDLFEKVGDWQRAEWCRNRMTYLSIKGIESDCD